MDDTSSKLSRLDSLTLDEADRIVDEMRNLFNRTLAGWASDVLKLQRDGFDMPRWRLGDPPNQWSKAA